MNLNIMIIICLRIALLVIVIEINLTTETKHVRSLFTVSTSFHHDHSWSDKDNTTRKRIKKALNYLYCANFFLGWLLITPRSICVWFYFKIRLKIDRPMIY